VAKNTEYTVAGYPATLVEATSTNAASGTPVGTTVYAYLVDLGSAGTGFIETSSASGAPSAADTGTVDLIASTLNITAPS
jgi:hypothetical protein